MVMIARFVKIFKIVLMVQFPTLIGLIELTELIKFIGWADFENQRLATRNSQPVTRPIFSRLPPHRRRHIC